MFYFHNLVGYKNPEEKIIIVNHDQNNSNENLVKVKSTKSNEAQNPKRNESKINNENEIGDNNLNFIDFNFINSNRENLDNIINNIIRFNKSKKQQKSKFYKKNK